MMHARRFGRAERWWILGVFALGLLVRSVGVDRLGLQHFDEAIYALSGLWSKGVPFNDDLHFFAPPLLPIFIGASYWFVGGPSDLAAIAVNLCAGALTVPAVWWVGRRWYGPAAGLAAACLAASSGIHILYSRMALTDVLLTMWFVLALGCMSEALSRRSFLWAVAAGVVTALAWNTKYNGWLPVLIASVPAATTLVRGVLRGSGFQGRIAACWLTAVAVALTGYLPWLLYVEDQPGGYAKLVAHHRGYLVGWDGWWGSLRHQAANLRELDGVTDRLAVAGALLLAGIYQGVGRRGGGRLAVATLGLAAAALQLGGLVANLALIAVPLVIGRRLPRGHVQPVANSDEGNAPTTLHATWFVVLLVLVPLYTPYERLVLPWLPAVWLASGAVLARGVLPILCPQGAPCVRRAAKAPMALITVIVIAAASLAVRLPTLSSARALRRTDHYRAAVAQLAKKIPSDAEVFVYAEPPVVFYLALGGGGWAPVYARPLAALEALDQLVAERVTARLLVLGPHQSQEPRDEQYLAANRKKRLRLIARFPIEEVTVEGGTERSALELYQVRATEQGQ